MRTRHAAAYCDINESSRYECIHCLYRLTARLEDLEEAIRDFWEKEESKLHECMKLREFHEEFKSVSR